MPPKNKKYVENRRLAQRICKKRKYNEIKNDPELLEIEKQKRRERYLKQKEAKKEKSFREIKEQRKRWKENSKRYRQKKKEEASEERVDPLLEKVNIEAVVEHQNNENHTDTEVPYTKEVDPLCEISQAYAKVKQVRYVELKKRKRLLRIIADYQKRDRSQRKQIKRLKKKIKEIKNLRQEPNIEESAIQINTNEKTGLSLIEQIQNFYTEDVHSVISAGKKEFITRNKVRMQKRYLCLPLKDLHKKFCSQTNSLVHYSLFCKHRPFWVLFPKSINRETCQCFIHTNMELLISAMNKQSILKEKNSEQVISKLCCDSRNIDCLQRICNTCRSNRLEYNLKNDDSNTFTYFQWVKISKNITKNGIQKKQKITVKKNININCKEAIVKIEKEIIPFLEHTYKMVGQYHTIKDIKNNITIQEALVHIDFSENYSLKYAEEVQSFHFGGSRQQVCLHTAVVYTHNFDTGLVTPTSMCTISNCLRHDASAVWAHLVPLLKQVIKLNPLIDTIHFVSDSPSSQYRNKTMFFIITQLYTDFSQLSKITWNYSEAGHGKGAPDGVGATLKRTADRTVLFGRDVGTYNQFYDLIKNQIENEQLNIIVEKVEEEDIVAKSNSIPKSLKPFKGTLLVHQVLWDKSNKTRITLRKMSCTECSFLDICMHGKHLAYYVINPPQLQKVRILSDITLKNLNNQGNILCKPSTSKTY